MLKIQIPKPCHEDWNAMTPTQQGAFCGACSKEVVDFTQMTDEAVQHYFLNRTSDKTCGRFRTEQVDRIQVYLPENILLQRIAGWKKFMAVIMLTFGSMLFGCNVDRKQDTGAVSKTQVTSGDTTQIESNQTLGIIAPEFSDTSLVEIKSVPCVVTPPVQMLTGEPVFIPDTVVPITMGRPLLLGAPTVVDTTIKKPASDTSKCKDTGYY